MLLLAVALTAALRGGLAAPPASDPFEAPPSPWSGSAPGVPSNPAAEARVPRVPAAQLHALMARIKGLIVVDTRDAYSYDAAHIRGAIDLPLFQFSKLYRELPKDRLIALYCT